MKRPWVLLGLLTVLAFLVRLALVPSSDGVDWDGPGYMLEAERLGDLFAGRFPSYSGARAPFIYPIGLPLLMRIGSAVLGSARDAGIALSLVAGTALVPVSFLLARSLGDDRAALLAASWVCLDPRLVERSHTVQSESVFGALLWAGMLPLVAATLARRRAVGGAALLAFAATVRSIGLPIGMIAALALALRGDRRLATLLALLLLAGAGLQAWIEKRNAAAAYWKTPAKLALWEENAYPGFNDVDDAGTSLHQGVDEVGPVTVLRERPGLAARIVAASTLAAGRALLPFALAVPFGLSRRSLLLAAAILVGALVPLLLLQHDEYMERMLLPFRPALLALAAVGVTRCAARARIELSSGAATALAVVVGLGSMLALARPLPSFSGLGALGSSRSPRALADATAARIAAAVPPEERVLRGPGGARTLIAIAGRSDVYAPVTTPARLQTFCAKNGIRFVLHDGSVPLERLFAPTLLATRSVGCGQLLSRIEPTR